MKRAIIGVMLFSAVVTVNGEERSSSIGLGIGPLYNGIGFGYKVPTSNSFSYFSVGCPSVGYGGDSGWLLNCGAGYSLVFAPTMNKKHGVGANLGVGYSHRGIGSGASLIAGVNYSYFFSGIDRRGWNIQAGTGMEYFRQELAPTGIIGFGYQF